MAFSTMSSVTRQLEGNYELKLGSPQQLSRVTSVGQQAAKLPCHGWVITKIASVGFARAHHSYNLHTAYAWQFSGPQQMFIP